MTLKSPVIAALPALLLVALALPFIPYPGLHQDELLFAGPLFDISTSKHFVNWFGHAIPLMVMTYLGCLKTWLYAPLFALTAPTVWSVRVPMVLLAAVTVALTFRLLDRLHSRRAAWIGSLLLATDSVFLLTAAFDWGPVAIQQVLTMGTIVVINSYRRAQQAVRLFVAGLLIGLAMWNKALFIWTLAGFAVATSIWAIAVWRRPGRRILTPYGLAAALIGAVLGAAPFLVFVGHSGVAAVGSGSGLDLTSIANKSDALWTTLDGSGLFGYLTGGAEHTDLRAPESIFESVVVAASHTLGMTHNYVIPWLLGMSVLALPWLRREARVTAGFFAVAGAIAWLAMAVTRDAGGSQHHTVLIWPLPQLVVAVVMADLSTAWLPARRLVILAVSAGVVVNLLVTNEYMARMIRVGSPGPWTEATHALIEGLRRHEPARPILVNDWGIDMPIRVALRGASAVDWIGMIEPNLNEHQEDYYRHIIEVPGLLWIAHAEGQQIENSNEAIEGLAHRLGFGVRLNETIKDRQGRRVYEIRSFDRRAR